MKIRPWGDAGLLVDVDDFHAAQHVCRRLRLQRHAGVRDIIPGYRTVVIEFDVLRVDLVSLTSGLRSIALQSAPLPTGILHELDVRYDGEDLGAIAQIAGLTVKQVIQRHSAAVYTVAFLGFSPGFPYLVGLDAALCVPRLSTPRSRVPAGAVAVADHFTGIYPQSTPGGWRLLGRTDAKLFDARRRRPAMLAPGDRVSFRACR